MNTDQVAGKQKRRHSDYTLLKATNHSLRPDYKSNYNFSNYNFIEDSSYDLQRSPSSSERVNSAGNEANLPRHDALKKKCSLPTKKRITNRSFQSLFCWNEKNQRQPNIPNK